MNQCQKIQSQYAALLGFLNRWHLLFAGGLKEGDRKEFIKQGKDLRLKISWQMKTFVQFYLSDKNIRRRLAEIMERLDLNINLDVENRWISFKDFSGSNDISQLRMIIDHKQSPITCLRLEYVPFSGQDNVDFEGLADSLMQPDNRVKYLNLAFCSLRDNEMSVIADVLKNSNNKLKKLYLFGNLITDAGVEILARSFRSPNNKLRVLNLRSGSISEGAIEKLRKIAGENCQIQF